MNTTDMKKMGLTLIYLWLVCFCSCQNELIRYEKGVLHK